MPSNRRPWAGLFSLAALAAAPLAAAPPTGAELVATAVEAMGGATAVAALDSLRVNAECTGPGGAYTSTVAWRRDGFTLMRQTDQTGERTLLAEGDRVWRLEGATGSEELPAELAAMVHGHAFHPTLFELDRRFHEHRAAGSGEDGCLRVEMLDEAGRPASVCLDPETRLPVRFSFLPAGPGGEIRMRLAGWRRVGELRYFNSFILEQGDEVYRWVYSTIEPNGLGGETPAVFGGDRQGASWRSGERISLSLKDADLAEVLRSFARLAGFNLVLDPSVRGAVTVELRDVPWERALEVILQTHGLGIEDDGAVWRVR